jgi:pyruvate/2-oxoacid:ferredoxin oxidoreductase alpha subunit
MSETTSTAPAVRFPGLLVDGSEAIARVETRLSEVACAYPVTPSTTGLRSTATA